MKTATAETGRDVAGADRRWPSLFPNVEDRVPGDAPIHTAAGGKAPGHGRAALAAQRLVAASAMLAHCRFCAHLCGANRLAGDPAPCRAGTQTRIFSAQLETSDELELIPTFSIALSGCNLRCDFCITGQSSWNARAGDLCSVVPVAAEARRAWENGARTIMFLGGEPTVHLHTVLEMVAALPDRARLVWKTNAFGSAEARKLLDGMFNVWVADYKFGNDHCAEKLAGIAPYRSVIEENLVWAHRNSDLIVRHLLMPGHAECCWRPVARWLSEYLPGVKVNLRSGFWPAWQARRHAELLRPVSEMEYAAARRWAEELNIHLIP